MWPAGDGLPDGTALALGLSATDPDMDQDGLLNGEELGLGTDPFVADSDGDGVLDGADGFPLDPTLGTLPPDPGDTTPPGVTLAEPAGAVLVSSNP